MFKKFISPLLIALALTANAQPAATPTDQGPMITLAMPEVIWQTMHGSLLELRTLLNNPTILANINTIMFEGKNALHWAAHNGHTACLKELVAAGANINEAITAGPHQGFTPLHIAARYGQAACLKVLIEGDANVNAAPDAGPNQGNTPLNIAATNGHTACLKKLLKHGAVNAAPATGPIQGHAPLHFAAYYGNLGCLEVLIAAQADVNAALTAGPNQGSTPLHFAASKGNTTCVQALIAAHANVNAATADGPNQGSTPLYVAAMNGHLGCLQALIAAHADVNMTLATGPFQGLTPLHWAAMKGHTTCVQALIAAHANVNACYKNGETPANTATKHGHLALARFLNDVQKKGPQAATTIEKTADEQCSICLCSFDEGDQCASLGCPHDFHADCIKQAAAAELRINDERRNDPNIGANYKSNASCPLCRAETEFTRERTQPTVVRTVHIIQPTKLARTSTDDTNTSTFEPITDPDSASSSSLSSSSSSSSSSSCGPSSSSAATATSNDEDEPSSESSLRRTSQRRHRE
ncbi:ankyrin repeat domain-containing protein [Candidatus Babeliales bacterium]|nr:ankyrin repeat domain-containing protein [Candidatus Babeliales bacterium]